MLFVGESVGKISLYFYLHAMTESGLDERDTFITMSDHEPLGLGCVNSLIRTDDGIFSALNI